MKKTWIISLIIIVIMIGIVTGIILYNTKQKDKNDNNMIENEINKISSFVGKENKVNIRKSNR